jgi:hypothetical protein
VEEEVEMDEVEGAEEGEKVGRRAARVYMSKAARLSSWASSTYRLDTSGFGAKREGIRGSGDDRERCVAAAHSGRAMCAMGGKR